ncbi:hypothetical protein SEVIR_1G284166v4 [Setaria viridis]
MGAIKRLLKSLAHCWLTRALFRIISRWVV